MLLPRFIILLLVKGVLNQCVGADIESVAVAVPDVPPIPVRARERDDMVGLQLVRRGSHFGEGEGKISRLITKPGEVSTTHV